MQCLGVAGRYCLSTWESESHIFEFLFFESGVSEKTAQLTDDVGAYGCLLAAGVLVVGGAIEFATRKINSGKRTTFHRIVRSLEFMSLLFVAGWFVADALAYMARGELYSKFVLGEVAVRYAAPLALGCLLLPGDSNGRNGSEVAKWILTIATSATFLIHGYKAVELYGPFTDLILLTDMKCFGIGFEQATVETGLALIGWIDIGLALVLVATRWRWTAAYMVFWGLLTAVSRMTAFGVFAWPETLVRTANWGSPLVLLLLCFALQSGKRSDNLEAGL